MTSAPITKKAKVTTFGRKNRLDVLKKKNVEKSRRLEGQSSNHGEKLALEQSLESKKMSKEMSKEMSALDVKSSLAV
jgi:hypothetical protein